MNPRMKLLLIVAVLASPVVAAHLTYHFWRPAKAMNYGELLPTKPIALDRLATMTAPPEATAGKWALVSVDGGACLAECRRKLFLQRQLRTAQGKHMHRIVRVWVVDDDVPPDLAREYEGTVMLRATPEFIDSLPAAHSPRHHLYLIDPLGNLVLRYPDDPDPGRIVKDLKRLLSVSQIG